MIVLINPNSTASMTTAMTETARSAAPNARIEGWTSHDGPPAIQGADDGARATLPMLKLVRSASAQGARAIIIGCFDDTALEDARAIANCPVVGIGQAAYHVAAMIGPQFSVVTTLGVSVPILEQNITAYGLRHAVARVRASEVPVLEIETNPDRAAEKILSEIVDAAARDNVQSVVLGCGGMVEIPARAALQTKLPIVDGVRAAAACASIF